MLLVTALGAAGCATAASVGDSVGALFAPADPRDAVAPEPGVQARVGYAARAGAEVRSRAARDAQLAGRLARHQEVRRYQVVDGFVFVTALGGDLAGWVRSGDLLERRPASAPAKPAARAKPAGSGAAPEPPPAPDEPEVTPDPEVTPEPEVAPAPPVQPRERSVFDPY